MRFTPEAIAKGLKVQDLDEEGDSLEEGGVERFEMAIPKGNVVIMDIYGVHRNRASIPSSSTVLEELTDFGANWSGLYDCDRPNAAMYWGTDCKLFKPERFIDTESYRWPRDACTSLSLSSSLLNP